MTDLPDGLYECGRCGQIRGVTEIVEDGERVPMRSTCLCDGFICHGCGRRTRRRPITDYWDPADGEWWHVPYFALAGGLCAWCRARPEGLSGS